MVALRLWVVSEWRRRWASLLLVAMIVAIGGGAVLLSLNGARRADTAFARFFDRVGAPNVEAEASLPESGDLGRFATILDRLDDIDALPGVERAFVSAWMLVGVEGQPSGFFTPVPIVSTDTSDPWQSVVVEGRLPGRDEADAIVVNEEAARVCQRRGRRPPHPRVSGARPRARVPQWRSPARAEGTIGRRHHCGGRPGRRGHLGHPRALLGAGRGLLPCLRRPDRDLRVPPRRAGRARPPRRGRRRRVRHRRAARVQRPGRDRRRPGPQDRARHVPRGQPAPARGGPGGRRGTAAAGADPAPPGRRGGQRAPGPAGARPRCPLARHGDGRADPSLRGPGSGGGRRPDRRTVAVAASGASPSGRGGPRRVARRAARAWPVRSSW